MNEITQPVIRAATPGDADAFHELLLMSAPFYETLFGENHREILTDMFRRRGNHFSHEHTIIGEVGGRLAGMLLAFGFPVKLSQAVPTALLLAGKLKSDLPSKLPLLIGYYRVMDIVRPGDFYLNNLAVYPEFRGHGVASVLMAALEPAARREGARRMTLEAEKENAEAIRLYEHLGFSTYDETKIQLDGEIEFLRMAKPL